MFPLKTTILRSKALKEKQELQGGQQACRPEQGLWGTTQGVCFVRERQTRRMDVRTDRQMGTQLSADRSHLCAPSLPDVLGCQGGCHPQLHCYQN